MRSQIIDGGIDIEYEPGFIEPVIANKLLEALITEADWHRPAMKMHGRTVYTCRQVAWHADEGYVYQYSGQEHEWRDWTPAMTLIRNLVQSDNAIIAGSHYEFNGVLLNMYANGDEYVSPHSDDERDLVYGAPVVAISLGAERDFVIKHNTNGNHYSLALKSGSMVIMRGNTQRVSKHSIPKRKKVTEPRISLTFRMCTRKVE